MSIRTDAHRDAGTGLLRRAAFRHELAVYLDNKPERDKRGCLLLVRFPVLQAHAKKSSSDSIDRAFCDLLAVLETRFRGRDDMGRLSSHSLCIHLRQCSQSDAHKIAREYLKLMNDLEVSIEGKKISVSPQIRVVSLDQDDIEHSTGVTVIPHRRKPKEAVLESLPSANSIDTSSSVTSYSEKFADVLVFDTEREYWRIEPSRWLRTDNNDAHLVRLRSLNKHVGIDNARNTLRILDALSLRADHRKRTPSRKIVVPAELRKLDSDALRWLIDQTRERRVSPADICFQITADELSEQMRSALPLLRNLHRAGFLLMLSNADDTSVLGNVQRTLKIDYIMISARRLQHSVSDEDVRNDIAKLVAMVQSEGSSVVASGVDSDHLLEHARALNIDLGFGRICGRSQPFESLSDGS